MNQFLWLLGDDGGVGHFINIGQIVQVSMNENGGLVLDLSNGKTFTISGDGIMAVSRILLEHSITLNGQKLSEDFLAEWSRRVESMARGEQ
jgi:hypothetical protein